jgi:GNAT superfamily N-acetyltransferase
MDPRELIDLQICMEYQLDERGLLIPINHSSEQAYYIVYQHLEGYVTYFNHELPANLRAQLLQLGPPAAFDHPDEVRQLITEAYLPCKGGEDIFWSGYFSHTPASANYPDACHHGVTWSVYRDEQEVCRALSIRDNERCAEVYVESLPAYRRRGFGRQVVAAWAMEIMNSGRVALYSYRLKNLASAALASSLGIEWYANVVTYEPG